MTRTLLLFLLAMASGCTGQVRDDSVGTLAIPLTFNNPDDAIYELTGGSLRIRGPQVDQTFDPSGRDDVRLVVGPGRYTIELTGNWSLTRNRDGIADPIDASLLSPNPLEVVVRPGATVFAMMRFATGDLFIGMTVNEGVHWMAGSFGFGQDGTVYDNQLVDYEMTFTSLTPASQELDRQRYVADGVLLQFTGGPPHLYEEVLPSLAGLPADVVVRQIDSANVDVTVMVPSPSLPRPEYVWLPDGSSVAADRHSLVLHFAAVPAGASPNRHPTLEPFATSIWGDWTGTVGDVDLVLLDEGQFEPWHLLGPATGEYARE